MATKPIAHSHPTDPLFSRFNHPLSSQSFYREYNEAGGEGGDGGDGGDDGKGDEGKGDDGKKKAAKPNPDDTQGRITELVSKNEALQKQIDEFTSAKKKEAEDKLKADGELQKLLDTKEQELAGLLPVKEQAKAYEDAMSASLKSTIEGIADKEKREAVEAQLEGLSVLEQYKRLPGLLKLVGSPADTSFGGKTPPGDKDAATVLAKEKAEFDELMKKPELTPAERARKNVLSVKLSAEFEKEQAKKRSESTTS